MTSAQRSVATSLRLGVLRRPRVHATCQLLKGDHGEFCSAPLDLRLRRLPLCDSVYVRLRAQGPRGGG
eukprot:9712662-Alexandrium_andersonii.AAC.1